MADFPVPPAPDPQPLSFASRWRSLGWLLWIVPTLALSAGAGVWAVKNLLALPDLPGCNATSQTDLSSSMRLYCAEQTANSNTVDDLRRAILFANRISTEDAFRPQADRLIQQWSQDILKQGDAAFQAGDLEKAIKFAEQIPLSVATAHQLANDRITHWNAIWRKAETLYNQTETEIDRRNWSIATSTARELLTIENTYWSRTKYRELMQALQAAKDLQASQNQQQTRRPASRSTDPVGEYLARREQERQQEASAYLAKARQLANSGNVESLEAAIAEARQVLFGTPRYDEAQQAIEAWQNQIETIEDRPYLERARELANQGDLESIEAAIHEARQIGWGRALYDEADAQVEQWQAQIQQLRAEQQTQRLETIDMRDAQVPPSSLQPSTIPSIEAIDPPN